MSNKPTDLVDRVLPCDVLLGRGKSIHYHPGNVEYREIVKARSCDYAHMKGIERDRLTPVSYTHLTLPTIYSV